MQKKVGFIVVRMEGLFKLNDAKKYVFRLVQLREYKFCGKVSCGFAAYIPT
jgi:hypothetical protein